MPANRGDGGTGAPDSALRCTIGALPSIDRILPISATLLVAVSIGGCGGPSAEGLRAAANEACGNTLSRIRAIGLLRGEPRRTQADRAIELAGRLKELRRHLAGLEAPGELRSRLGSYDGLLAEQQRSLEEVSELKAPPARVRSNLEAIDNGAGAAGADLGLDACESADIALQGSVRRPPRAG